MAANPSVVSSPRSAALTLFDLEQRLATYAGLLDAIEDPDRRAEALEEFGSVLLNAKEERDSAARFLRYCQSQEEFADEEIQRLKGRKERIARIRGEFEAFLVTLIDGYAQPDQRGVKRLEGNLSSLRIQRNPDSVAIFDTAAIPLRLKDFVITLPAYVWEALLECVGLEERSTFEAHVKRIEVKPDKPAIGAELKGGEPVRGAELQAGALRLVVS